MPSVFVFLFFISISYIYSCIIVVFKSIWFTFYEGSNMHMLNMESLLLPTVYT